MISSETMRALITCELPCVCTYIFVHVTCACLAEVCVSYICNRDLFLLSPEGSSCIDELIGEGEVKI